GPALNADRLIADHSLFCRQGFSARGEVRLFGAHIGGQLDCTGGHFSTYRYRFFTFEHGNEPALAVWPVVGALSPLQFWWAFSCGCLVFVEESSPPARRRCARCLARKAGLETAWLAGGDGRAAHN